MADTGAGQRSARRIVMGTAAVLIVVVAVVSEAVTARTGPLPLAPWYTGLAWCSAAVTFATGVAARWLPDAVLRTGAWLAVCGYGAVLLSFPLAVPPEGIDRAPWLLTATGAATASALVAGGRRTAWVTASTGAAVGLVYRAVYGGLDLDGVVNDSHALLTAAVICVVGGHVLSVGRGLDRAAARTTAAASRESAERGRLAARTRTSALVHDEVLATLRLAATELPVPRDRLAAQARDAAQMVTRLAAEDDDEGGGSLLRGALEAEARQHGASFSVVGDAVVLLPPASHDAIVGAARQALVNSSQHAGEGVARAVVLRAAPDRLDIEISDDGRGFDPDAVADDRLGIRQSIVGRMSRLDGGHAEIDSAPGRGTVVRLRCAPARPRALDASGDRRGLRRGVGAIVFVFVLTQTVSAVAAAIAVPGSLPVQLGLLLLALCGGEVLRRTPTRVPGVARTIVVSALAVTGLVAGSALERYSYGTTWFAVAFAFLFVTLALRGRIRVALIGGGLIVLTLVAAGVASDASTAQILQVLTRPVVVILLAATLLVIVERIQRRTAALHQAAVASAERESWSLAARAELTMRAAALVRTVVPLLERIAAGGVPTAADRRAFASWEGELRDGLRAGALAREPITSAVATARERGVDVVLLDDSGHGVPDALLEPVLVWMAEAIRTARSEVVGRLLPAGRPDRASVAIDGRHAAFAAQEPSSSFQGE